MPTKFYSSSKRLRTAKDFTEPELGFWCVLGPRAVWGLVWCNSGHRAYAYCRVTELLPDKEVDIVVDT